MKSWQDFDKITLAQLPLFLFSATFFPVTRLPRRRCAGWSSARRSTAASCCAAS